MKRLIHVMALAIVTYGAVSLVVLLVQVHLEHSAALSSFAVSVDASSQRTEKNENRHAKQERLYFPEYGTPEFETSCPWAVQHQPKHSNCSFLVRPDLDENEGIAMWTAQIATVFMVARQANCRVWLDYGKNVDITQVLRPTTAGHNWTVPTKDFECSKIHKCFRLPIETHYAIRYLVDPLSRDLGLQHGQSLVSVPWYRMVYSRNSMFRLNRTEFQDTAKMLPNFQAETGMACSINSLFQLSSTASQFEPILFTKLLPALRNPQNLVLTLYIRTGYTDHPDLDDQKHRRLAEGQAHVDCAMKQEQQRHSQSIIWMVITDSPHVKQWIHKTYNDDTNRTILTTSSRGKHTRAKGKPSTRVFAEGILDWYLIGESDLVIMHDYSFGMTASLRTARPVYDAMSCTQLSMFQ